MKGENNQTMPTDGTSFCCKGDDEIETDLVKSSANKGLFYFILSSQEEIFIKTDE